MNTNHLPPAKSIFNRMSEPELLNSLPDGAYITDVNRKILFWNHAAEHITGWRAEEVVGKSCFDNILCHVDKDGHVLCGHDTCPLHRSIITNQPSSGSVLLFAQCKSKRRVPVEVSVSPVTDETGAVVGGIEVFRDLRHSLHDLMRAKSIQEQALTSKLPGDPRVEFQTIYQALEIVGGDFYRIEQLSPNRYGMLVADAIGHGIAAALYTMQLSMLWEEHRDKLNTPSAFMRALNKRLHELVMDDGFFCTASYIIYDAGSGQLRCVRAGHPSPVIFHGDLKTETIGHGESALGMKADAEYTEFQARLATNDTLLMFTDCATEIFDDKENELELAGLIRMVHGLMAGEANGGFNLEKLREKLLEFTNQITLPDDLTLLKLRRRI